MTGPRKATLVLGAPLTLAALLGGAAAFASQAGGSAADPARIPHSGYERVTFGDGAAHDGSDCPRDKGASSDAPVSPAVY
ncbi:MAG: hypothetical protein C0506_04805 [Anaerolinea sp.]|nr:hypothetical protein [Anaerolinea sp.]